VTHQIGETRIRAQVVEARRYAAKTIDLPAILHASCASPNLDVVREVQSKRADHFRRYEFDFVELSSDIVLKRYLVNDRRNSARSFISLSESEIALIVRPISIRRWAVPMRTCVWCFLVNLFAACSSTKRQSIANNLGSLQLSCRLVLLWRTHRGVTRGLLWSR